MRTPTLFLSLGMGLLVGALIYFDQGASIPASAQPPTTPDPASLRVRQGLQVLYDFSATSGPLVKDRSGVGKPIDVYARETLFATLGIERFEWFVGSDADHQRDAQPDDAYHLLPDRHARAFAAAFIEEFQHVISPGVRLLTAP